MAAPDSFHQTQARATPVMQCWAWGCQAPPGQRAPRSAPCCLDHSHTLPAQWERQRSSMALSHWNPRPTCSSWASTDPSGHLTWGWAIPSPHNQYQPPPNQYQPPMLPPPPHHPPAPGQFPGRNPAMSTEKLPGNFAENTPMRPRPHALTSWHRPQ